MDEAPVFNWINLYSALKWNIIEKVCNLTTPNLRETFKRIENSEKLFDNSGFIKIFVEQRCSQWEQKACLVKLSGLKY